MVLAAAIPKDLGQGHIFDGMSPTQTQKMKFNIE